MNDEKRLDDEALEKVSGGGVQRRSIDSLRIIAILAATIMSTVPMVRARWPLKNWAATCTRCAPIRNDCKTLRPSLPQVRQGGSFQLSGSFSGGLVTRRPQRCTGFSQK